VNRDLARSVLAELLGTAFLVAAVVGSGIAADRDLNRRSRRD
jgi:glycerol uptake facilitator-like aquaporin